MYVGEVAYFDVEYFFYIIYVGCWYGSGEVRQVLFPILLNSAINRYVFFSLVCEAKIYTGNCSCQN